MNARWVAAVVALFVLLSLLAWQQQRLALVEACHAAGGWWDGNRSRCGQLKTERHFRAVIGNKKHLE